MNLPVVITMLALMALTDLTLCDARTCVCTTTNVNVRTCASSSCTKLGVATTGTCLDYLGQSSGSWRKVSFNGKNAWLHGAYASGPQVCGGPGTGLCTATVCSSFSSNQARACDAQGCGHYGAPRGSGTHGGLDVKCTATDDVVAPFPGTLVRQAKPYGNPALCCDNGLLFAGSGAWVGYEVKLFYVRPVEGQYGSTFSQGQTIATHIGLSSACQDPAGAVACYESDMTDHTHFQFYKDGVKIDPTSFVLCQ